MLNSKTCHKKTNTNRVYNKKGPKNKKDTYSSLYWKVIILSLKLNQALKHFEEQFWNMK